MRRLFLALLLLLISAAAAIWLRDNDGYVVLGFGAWRAQISLILFAGVLVALYLAIWAVLALVSKTVRLPSGVRRWLSYRREGRARDRLVNGLLTAAEGRYREAETLLRKAAGEPRVSLLGYLLAAEVAQRGGDYGARDDFIALADQARQGRGRRNATALRLMQAEWHVQAGQWEHALATLTALRENDPNHPRVLTLLRDTALALEDWDLLAELLPALKRAGAVDDPGYAELERRAALGRLARCGRDAGALERIFGQLSKALRRDHTVVLAYAEAALDAGRSDLAEPPLRTALGREWDPRLAACYGRLELETPQTALTQAESWLKDRPEDPELLLAAGRLAAAAELWARARSYVEAAVNRRESPDGLRLLGELHERLGDMDAARDAFDRALRLAVPGQSLTVPAPETARSGG